MLERTDAEIVDACEKLVRNYDPCISCSTHAVKIQINRSKALNLKRRSGMLRRVVLIRTRRMTCEKGSYWGSRDQRSSGGAGNQGNKPSNAPDTSKWKAPYRIEFDTKGSQAEPGGRNHSDRISLHGES